MIKDNEGQSLVEWALILPLFLMLFIGLIDFGWAFGKQHAISQISKELARSASIGYSVDELKTEAFEMSKAVFTPSTITDTVANNNTIFTITDGNGKEIIITFEESLDTRVKGKGIKVIVNYIYQPFTPFVNNAEIPLSGEAYTKAETSPQ
jgi:Flp pilus assembly protein TadG